ncbi:hypothetical protein BGP_2832 [Beggiatoa sp. PS]|nr:hypothetical protein BGP_2832 [Beggiatoa sp. PS]
MILTQKEVWHQIELTNQTKKPWTAGSVMLMQGNQPLGQEVLTYTSPKNQALIPITISVDTQSTVEDKELSREEKALSWFGELYTQIHKEATLKLRNSKPISINAEITFRFGGKVEQVSDNGQATVDVFNQADWENYRNRSKHLNNRSTVSWQVTIKPGETFTPKVRYHYYW